MNAQAKYSLQDKVTNRPNIKVRRDLYSHLKIIISKDNYFKLNNYKTALDEIYPYLTIDGFYQKDNAYIFDCNFDRTSFKGHYKGFPSLPMTSIGQAFLQAFKIKKLFIDGKRYSLFDRIEKFKVKTMGIYSTTSKYQVILEDFGDKNRLSFVENSHRTISVAQNLNCKPEVLPIKGIELTPKLSLHEYIPHFSLDNNYKCIILSYESIKKLIPQSPPFLGIKAAKYYIENNKISKLVSRSSFSEHEFSGHYRDNPCISVSGYSRALSQSGMIFCSLLFNNKIIAEVVSIPKIIHHTNTVFPPTTNIYSEIEFKKQTTISQQTFVVICAKLYINNRIVFEIPEIRYIAIITKRHPINSYSRR
jgi:3-hydroxymyristoyl/3-hydroxydecanoyl-(acyl carrier protein) dehydratase